MTKTKFVTRSPSRNSSRSTKPFTDAELSAKVRGEIQLALAQLYRQRGDNERVSDLLLDWLKAHIRHLTAACRKRSTPRDGVSA